MSEFKGKNRKDLVKTLKENRDALQKFRFEMSGSRSKNVKAGYNLRKDIAIILTELNTKEVAEVAPKAEVVKVAKPVKKAVKKAKAVKTK